MNHIILKNGLVFKTKSDWLINHKGIIGSYVPNSDSEMSDFVGGLAGIVEFGGISQEVTDFKCDPKDISASYTT